MPPADADADAPADAAAGAAAGVDDLTYEQARDELAEVVRALEAGSGTLEESLALWERGEALAVRCQYWLDGARRRLEAATGAPNDDDQPATGQ